MGKLDRDAEFVVLVEKIRRDVEARCGCPVYSRLLQSLGYSLYKSQGSPQYVFASIYRRVEDNKLCEIQSAEKWAKHGGVNGLADHSNDKGWHDEPAVYWYIIEGDVESYHRAIRALSIICQVR